ncbi:MAG: hypothetical protein U0234_19910 [Sandaracinus sp.]
MLSTRSLTALVFSLSLLALAPSAHAHAQAAPLLAPTAPPPHASLAPSTLDEATPESAPRTRPIWSLVGVGAGLFAGGYALNLVGSGLWMLVPTGVYASDLLVPTWNGHRSEFFYWSTVPLIGPFFQIGYAEEDWMAPLLVIDGVLQIGGLVTALVGTFARESVPPRGGASIQVVPMLSAQNVGLVAAGTF